MIGWRLTIVGLVILLSTVSAAFAVDQWYFTAEEIEVAYRYQQNFGRRLRHPLKPQNCYFGETEFTASFQGKEFFAPCRFIHRTTNHLKVMLENGAARIFSRSMPTMLISPFLSNFGGRNTATPTALNFCRRSCMTRL
jgi:hypothetical protein